MTASFPQRATRDVRQSRKGDIASLIVLFCFVVVVVAAAGVALLLLCCSRQVSKTFILHHLRFTGCVPCCLVVPSSMESTSLEKALIERFKGNLHMQNVGSGGERASCGKPHFFTLFHEPTYWTYWTLDVSDVLECGLLLACVYCLRLHLFG